MQALPIFVAIFQGSYKLEPHDFTIFSGFLVLLLVHAYLYSIFISFFAAAGLYYS